MGTGRAFRCEAEACGAAATLYLRPKVGFCNCAKGVYDNAELDRVDDLALLGPEFSGLGDSRRVSVGWMQGRSRVFRVSGPYQGPSAAAAIAFNDKCDVVVATVTAEPTRRALRSRRSLSSTAIRFCAGRGPSLAGWQLTHESLRMKAA